jgi:hypothetical protein
MNHVFISYRHESDEHKRAVRRLAELLRQTGIPVELDSFFLDKNPGGPDEGWPAWSEHRATKSVCVLIIASRGWFASYEGTEPPGTGRGVASEADLFRQELWDEKGHNARIRLAFLDGIDLEIVPVRLRAWHQFRPFDSNQELDQLIAWLADRLQLGPIQSPTVRWPDPWLDFPLDFANRHLNEWPAIQAMLAGRSPHRILLLEGESGFGKSELVEHATRYATELGIPVARLDFRANYGGIPDLLGRLANDLGEYLPRFMAGGGDKPNLLIKDLRELRRPILIVFDTFEKASPIFRDWVCQNLLAEVERALALSIVVAGQSELPNVDDVRWRAVARRLSLGPIHEVAHWEPWVQRRFPNFGTEISIHTLVLVSQGVPKIFFEMCRMLGQRNPLPPSSC